jgi:hypothetical protein
MLRRGGGWDWFQSQEASLGVVKSVRRQSVYKVALFFGWNWALKEWRYRLSIRANRKEREKWLKMRLG